MSMFAYKLHLHIPFTSHINATLPRFGKHDNESNEESEILERTECIELTDKVLPMMIDERCIISRHKSVFLNHTYFPS